MPFKNSSDCGNTNGGVVESIKKDIVASLKLKGVNILKVHVDMDSNNMNVEVCIDESSTCSS
jgi:hypothetical protein